MKYCIIKDQLFNEQNYYKRKDKKFVQNKKREKSNKTKNKSKMKGRLVFGEINQQSLNGLLILKFVEFFLKMIQ